jgi:hypothetical protein
MGRIRAGKNNGQQKQKKGSEKMKCFSCKSNNTRTIYPKGHVQKMCMDCNWKSYPIKIPDSIKRVQA